MRKILFAILGGLLIAGCREKGPGIVLEKKAVEDSLYTLTTIPVTEPHNVLVEEFTGAKCPSCPDGHDKLRSAKDKNVGKVIVLGLYKYNIIQTSPLDGTVYDFRDSAATVMADQLYNGVNILPTAIIDRIPFDGDLKIINRGAWGTVIDERCQNTVDSLNLKVESSYDSRTNEIVITANIVYTKSVATPQNLSIAIVEDSIVDKQEFSFGSPYPNDVNPAYVFTDVFRTMVTAVPFGDPILNTTAVKTPGMGLQRRYIYKLKSNVSNPIINLSHCRVVAFVTNAIAGAGCVQQAAEARLKP